MDITLNRLYSPSHTMGRLYVPDSPHDYYTIEKPWLYNTPFKSCVPEGRYECKPYSSKKFPNVWEVCDVPNRTYILIHIGNWVEDIVGCIAVGTGSTGNNMVTNSGRAIEQLRSELPDRFYLTILEA